MKALTLFESDPLTWQFGDSVELDFDNREVVVRRLPHIFCSPTERAAAPIVGRYKLNTIHIDATGNAWTGIGQDQGGSARCRADADGRDPH